MFLAWVVFPLVLALVCAGLGLAGRGLLKAEIDSALTLPFGFAILIVLAGLITASPTTAPATVVVVGLAAIGGLARHIGRRITRPDPWAIALGIAVLLAFGAPVILSGQATFTGYIRLDDTATWLSIVDRVLGHGRSLAELPPSTYALNLHAYLHGMGYPLGAFLPLAVGRALVGVDAAWVFQPFLAFCGVMLGLIVYAVSRPLIERRPLRAATAFLAAQPALLYGYALWGGIKELVAAVLVALLAAFVAGAMASPTPAERRRTIGGVAIVAAAVAGTLGPGAAAWLGPGLGAVVVCWLWHARRERPQLRLAVLDTGLLAGATAVLMLPVWLALSDFIAGNSVLFGSSGATSSSGEGGLVSLYHPLSVWQLGGVWPIGDFRLTASAARTVPLLIAVVIGLAAGAAAVAAGGKPLRRTLIVYPLVALFGCLLVWIGGSNPWVVAKALAISSPAIPAAALCGAAALVARNRPAGLALLTVIGAGVLWSNVLGYHDATLAPRARLAELQRIAPLLRGPTLVNEYEIYADRHFLRNAAPTEPAEYRPYQIPLSDGALLTQTAQADLDAFSTDALLGFRSIVTRTSPVASRPPSIYTLRWRGRYYELWQRPASPPQRILLHVPFGDASVHPFCGQSTTRYEPLCADQPVAPAPCSLIRLLARRATADQAELVAFQRPAPIVARADQSRWPGRWQLDPAAHTLTPTAPGVLDAQIAVGGGGQRYAVWLGGSFARGFEVSVDGHDLGTVKDQLENIGQYIEVGTLNLSPGVHTIALRYPSADLTPGSGAQLTQLSAIALQPLDQPATTLLTVAPQQASELCGRELDWVELVRGF